MRYSAEEESGWFKEAQEKGARFIVVGCDRFHHSDDYYAAFVDSPTEVFNAAKQADGVGGSCETVYILVDGKWENFYFYSSSRFSKELWELRYKLEDPVSGVSAYKRHNYC